MNEEQRKARAREHSRKYRDKLKAAGLKRAPRSEASKAQNRAALAERRALAKQSGEVLPSDAWFINNPEAHRARVEAWRTSNPERNKANVLASQAKRRSTPWGAINNRIWPIVHGGVRRSSARMGKYNISLGYTWLDLRHHLEAQFAPEMTWDNWGSVWELDHIEPLSGFFYRSIDAPEFRRAWALRNLRPLSKEENRNRTHKRKLRTT